MSNSNNKPITLPKYDYIFIGAGLSSLLILWELSKNPLFYSKRVLVIDPRLKDYEEKTWCFWTKNPAIWQSIATQTWQKAGIYEADKSINLQLQPYHYQMLKASSFRSFVLNAIQNLQIDWLEDTVEKVIYPEVYTSTQKYVSAYIFDSRLDERVIEDNKGYNFYQQFVGFTIEFDEHEIPADFIRLMDFRMDQPKAVAFCYVLPMDSKTVLVEYTLFTPNVRKWEELKEGLHLYLNQHYSDKPHHIKEMEKGIIPMSDAVFTSNHPHWIKIGTGGGLSKPSTGYTFHFAEKHAQKIVQALAKGQMIPTVKELYSQRFLLYDKVLLSYLEKNPTKGAQIFYRLFDRNPTKSVFDFLNNESNWMQELKIFSSLPISSFIQAAFRVLFK